MASRTLTKEQRGSLDFQTDQLYESFRRTLDTQSHQEAIWNNGLFKAYEKSLNAATNYSAFMDWKRDTKRALVFDKYILHYAVGSNSSHNLEQDIQFKQFGHGSKAKETDVTVDSLKKAIDNNKVSYHIIQSMVMSLTNAHDFAGIADVLGYVREKHQKSSE